MKTKSTTTKAIAIFIVMAFLFATLIVAGNLIPSNATSSTYTQEVKVISIEPVPTDPAVSIVTIETKTGELYDFFAELSNSVFVQIGFHITVKMNNNGTTENCKDDSIIAIVE